MTTPIFGTTNTRIQMDATRPRQTAKPTDRFTEVLRTGADVLLAGAGAATGLVGGPLLSAAIGAARAGLARAGTSGNTVRSGTSPLGTTPASPSGTSSGTSDMEAMRQIQREGQEANLTYLRLQTEMQQENRRFSVASNVLKAKHDTARAAINNVRV